MSLVDLGKRLLEASKRGDTDEVRSLMANGAPFTTDWVHFVSAALLNKQTNKFTNVSIVEIAGLSIEAFVVIVYLRNLSQSLEKYEEMYS